MRSQLNRRRSRQSAEWGVLRATHVCPTVSPPFVRLDLPSPYPVAMAGVAVVTDSTSSLARTAATRAGIAVISLQVVIDGESRPESEVDRLLVATALREGKQVTTSRPSPQAFSAVYESLAVAGHEEVVSVHLSSRISGTCEAAEVAAREASSRSPWWTADRLAWSRVAAALSGAECALAGGSAAEVAATRQDASAGLDDLLLRRQSRLPSSRRPKSRLVRH